MKRILVLYTGGTIGCEGEPLAPMSAERFGQQLASEGLLREGLSLRALPTPLDSASMQPADWLDIAEALLAAWTEFDGFVVLHGTDTLAYTAAALSFLLVGMDKPVVLTGSQHPLAAKNSDAQRNFRDAIAAVEQSGLCEVAVCFARRILRGNRSVKTSASRLDAFDSPNWPDLGAIDNGVVNMHAQAMLPTPAVAFEPDAIRALLSSMRGRLASNPVWVVHLHPGFPVSLLSAALALSVPPRGWLLASYGTGNAPEDLEFLSALSAAAKQGVVVVAVTQTGHGAVELQTYHAGASMAAADVISGKDLTLPAAVAKLQLTLASGLARDEVAIVMTQAMAGESI